MGRFDEEEEEGSFLPSSAVHTMMLAGMVLAVLGSLIVIFDYPQIEYLGGFDTGMQSGASGASAADAGQRDIHERLVIEFFIGAAMLMSGAAMCAPKVVSSLGRRRT